MRKLGKIVVVVSLTVMAGATLQSIYCWHPVNSVVISIALVGQMGVYCMVLAE